MKIAVYPGTFDPITNGHIDVVKRSLKLFDKVYMIIAHNIEKRTLFTVEERIDMIKHSVNFDDRIIVGFTKGLTVEYAQKIGAIAIIRGLRAISDYEHELQLAHINRKIDTKIESIFLMPALKYSFVSSSLIKDLIIHNGDVSTFVTPYVEKKLREKYNAL